MKLRLTCSWNDLVLSVASTSLVDCSSCMQNRVNQDLYDQQVYFALGAGIQHDKVLQFQYPKESTHGCRETVSGRTFWVSSSTALRKARSCSNRRFSEWTTLQRLFESSWARSATTTLSFRSNCILRAAASLPSTCCRLFNADARLRSVSSFPRRTAASCPSAWSLLRTAADSFISKFCLYLLIKWMRLSIVIASWRSASSWLSFDSSPSHRRLCTAEYRLALLSLPKDFVRAIISALIASILEESMYSALSITDVRVESKEPFLLDEPPGLRVLIGASLLLNSCSVWSASGVWCCNEDAYINSLDWTPQSGRGY